MPICWGERPKWPLSGVAIMAPTVRKAWLRAKAEARAINIAVVEVDQREKRERRELGRSAGLDAAFGFIGREASKEGGLMLVDRRTRRVAVATPRGHSTAHDRYPIISKQP
ncbi:hypothetical protein GmRootV116_05790 [Variovorax sp. V116]